MEKEKRGFPSPLPSIVSLLFLKSIKDFPFVLFLHPDRRPPLLFRSEIAALMAPRPPSREATASGRRRPHRHGQWRQRHRQPPYHLGRALQHHVPDFSIHSPAAAQASNNALDVAGDVLIDAVSVDLHIAFWAAFLLDRVYIMYVCVPVLCRLNLL
jgi:hypothetical protein